MFLVDFLYVFFVYVSGDHRDLHVLTHSFPTRRSSDLIVNRLEAWLHGIAETDIDDNCYAGPGERGCSAQADATILQLLADGSGLQRIEIKGHAIVRSEEHTSELQSLMRNSYAVFCLKKKNNIPLHLTIRHKQNT